MDEQLILSTTLNLAKEKGFLCQKLRPENDYLEEQPTQSYLQTWLRKKHHLHVHIACSSLVQYFPMIEELQVDGIQMRGPVFKIFRTYEEALEFGLDEALKLIKY